MKLLLLTSVLALGLQASPATAQWRPMTHDDPMGKNSEMTYIVQDRKSSIQTIAFGFRCHLRSKKWGLTANFDTYLGENNNLRLRYDDGKVTRHSTAISADETALISWINVRREMKRVLAAEKLAVQTFDYRGVEHTAVFDIRGFRDAVQKHPGTCLLP